MLRKKLILALLLIGSISLLASCSKDDGDKTYYYSAGFASFSFSSSGDLSSNLEKMIEEMTTIESVFYTELEVTSSPFSLTGSQEKCDLQVRTACEAAAETLRAVSWHGTYSYDVINVSTEEVVFSLALGEPEAAEE
ncbi:MAG: hypothetical protein LBM07_02975 [Culturomica sp.]|jgi:hypothetical protein|nr:hypothetical protein [Culturomica sp.]